MNWQVEMTALVEHRITLLVDADTEEQAKELAMDRAASQPWDEWTAVLEDPLVAERVTGGHQA